MQLFHIFKYNFESSRLLFLQGNKICFLYWPHCHTWISKWFLAIRLQYVRTNQNLPIADQNIDLLPLLLILISFSLKKIYFIQHHILCLMQGNKWKFYLVVMRNLFELFVTSVWLNIDDGWWCVSLLLFLEFFYPHVWLLVWANLLVSLCCCCWF